MVIDTSRMMNPFVIPLTRASRLFFPFLTSSVSYLSHNWSSSSCRSFLFILRVRLHEG